MRDAYLRSVAKHAQNKFPPMKFTDEGIIISQKNYSENSLILKIFSRHHGIYRGFVKAGKSRKNQVIFQVGNLISFEWRSRIEDGLGQIYYPDLIKSFAEFTAAKSLKPRNKGWSAIMAKVCCPVEFDVFPEEISPGWFPGWK